MARPATRKAVVGFVERAESGPDHVPPRAFHDRLPADDELLRYLEANGFTNYIASGGDRDFMRPVTEEIYGIPSQRVIGSSNTLAYTDDEHGGTVSYQATPDVSRRRADQAGAHLEPHRQTPILAGGKDRPALRLLVLHDDDEREFDYVAGAEESLDRAREQDRTVVSMKSDWPTVFAEAPAPAG